MFLGIPPRPALPVQGLPGVSLVVPVTFQMSAPSVATTLPFFLSPILRWLNLSLFRESWRLVDFEAFRPANGKLVWNLRTGVITDVSPKRTTIHDHSRSVLRKFCTPKQVTLSYCTWYYSDAYFCSTKTPVKNSTIIDIKKTRVINSQWHQLCIRSWIPSPPDCE